MRGVRPSGFAVIKRARLDALLDHVWGGVAMTVVAPPGFGKSIAVDSWRAAQAAAVPWVSVDSEDNDPVRLWGRIASAIASECDGLGSGASTLLQGPLATVRPAIDALGRELESDGRDVALVLDDLHLIDGDACRRSLELAADALPGNLRLVLLARTGPPVRVSRLRSRGALVEIHARELAFTRDETAQLVAVVGGDDLAGEVAGPLHERTRGWPVAVYLGALWLRDGPEPVAAVQRLALEADHVAEYVAAEILDGLEPALRRFLLRSSSLDPVSGPLCDDALPSEGSGELLARLQRQSLLVTRVRGRPGWFAYHALFRELLRAQLDETEPGAAAAIQRRATQWCVDHELAEEAAAYAIGAGDLTALAGLLDQHYPRLLRSGHTETVARWIRAFPEDGLRERPAVVVAMAWAEFIAGAPAARLRRLLALAHDGRTRQPGSWSLSLEVPWLLLSGLTTSGGVQASIAAIAAALDLARTERPDLVPGALGALAHVHELAGDFEQAQADALAAIEHPTASRRLYGIPSAMGTLALIDCARDRVASAREHLDAARKLVRESGAEDSPTGARLHIIDAVVSLTEQRYSHAERAAQRGLNQAFYSDIGHAWALLVLADVRVRRGRIAAAKQPLGHALEILAATPDAGRLTVFAAEVQEAARATEANLRRPAEPLSPAELAVVRLLPAMPTSRELAASLVLSPNTVKSQLRAIYRKLGVSSRADALARAVELGLIDRAEPEVATPNEPALDRRERAR